MFLHKHQHKSKTYYILSSLNVMVQIKSAAAQLLHAQYEFK